MSDTEDIKNEQDQPTKLRNNKNVTVAFKIGGGGLIPTSETIPQNRGAKGTTTGKKMTWWYFFGLSIISRMILVPISLTTKHRRHFGIA